MTDIVSANKRSQMMAGIRGKDTKPEVAIRTALFSRGLRYRIHDTRLPGKPDIVFPGRKAVIFVDGCFWHFHHCHLFKMPASKQEFWQAKIKGNQQRDIRVRNALETLGWRHLTVWECSLKGKTRLPFSAVIDRIQTWLESSELTGEIEGNQDGNSRPK